MSDLRVKPPAMPLVAVTWDDAHVDGTGEKTDDEIAALQPYQFMTFGILVRQDDVVVVIAQERGEDGRWRGCTTIPMAMVLNVTELGSAASLIRDVKKKRSK